MSTRLDDYQREAASRSGRAAVSLARAVLRATHHTASEVEKADARDEAYRLLENTVNAQIRAGVR